MTDQDPGGSDDATRRLIMRRALRVGLERRVRQRPPEAAQAAASAAGDPAAAPAKTRTPPIALMAGAVLALGATALAAATLLTGGEGPRTRETPASADPWRAAQIGAVAPAAPGQESQPAPPTKMAEAAPAPADDAVDLPLLGARVRPIADPPGLRVLNVVGAGAGDLRAGDVILDACNDAFTGQPAQLAEALVVAAPACLTVLRNGAPLRLDLSKVEPRDDAAEPRSNWDEDGFEPAASRAKSMSDDASADDARLKSGPRAPDFAQLTPAE